MIIAVDLMGGDRAPENILKGVFEASRERKVELVLVGDEKIVNREINRLGAENTFFIHHSSQVAAMDEDVATVLKKKPDSSIMSSFKLLSDNKAQAVISAGNSKATVAVGLHTLGMLEGIKRPALVSHFPSKKGKSVILDIGANVDSTEENLKEFAYMGSLFAEIVLKKKEPSVAILSNGEESEKGNKLTKSAHRLLSNDKLINYTGYIEGSSIFEGYADVIVCDGFVGNIVLKSSEAVARAIFNDINHRTSLEKLKQKDIFQPLKDAVEKFDFTRYGGAILLGVKGLCSVCHGSASPLAVKNAIFQTQDFFDMNLACEFESKWTSRFISKL